MSLDAYVTLGRSGLRVSPMALGTMTFGEDWGWGSSVAECEALLDRYVERGGNFIDTANFYTYGHAEVILGDHLARRRGLRERLVVATKFFSSMRPGDPNGGGAGRKSIMDQVEQSLRRLRTDHVDLYWLHMHDRHTPIDETLRAMDDLVTSGKVRYLGVSDMPAWKAAEAQTIAHFRGWAPLVAAQFEYSLKERTVESDLIPMCQDHGLGVTPWAPLKGGLLSGKVTRTNAGTVRSDRGARITEDLAEADLELLDRLAAIAGDRGTGVASVSLAWLGSRPGVSSIILGARTVAQLDANIAALDVRLTAEEIAALDDLTTPPGVFPQRFLAGAADFGQAGATVNGVTSRLLPFAPASDDSAY